MKNFFPLLLRLTLCWFSAFASMLGITLPVMAQQITLKGQVSILNSGYHNQGQIQYIQNARISAAKAMPGITDATGNFNLTFVGQASGSIVGITVAKQGYEVANARDLQAAVLGSAPPLRVFMADSMELAREQAILYGINLKVLTSEKDKLVAQLRGDSATSRVTLAELQKRFGREFEHRWAVEDYVVAQLEETKKKLPKRVAEMARVNLDFASERYRVAYARYKEGEIGQLLSLFEGLDDEAAGVVQHMESLGKSASRYGQAMDAVSENAQQVAACYRLKAEAYDLRFEYRKAAEVLEKGAALLLRVKQGVEDLEVGEIYGELGRFYQGAGDYPLALKNMELDLGISKRLLHGDDLGLGTCYNNLAMVLKDMGDFSKASTAQQQDIAILEKVLKPHDPKLASSYSNLVIILQSTGDYTQALEMQQKAIKIQEKALYPNSFDLAISYTNLAMILKEKGNYSLALITQRKAITIQENVLQPDHPELATSYNNLALIHQANGKFPKALVAQQKAISIWEKVFGSDHPKLAATSNNLACILLEMGDYPKALSAAQKAIAIQEKMLGPNHPALAQFYSNLGSIHQIIGDYPLALASQQKAINICEQSLGLAHPNLPVLYNNLATTLEALDEYSKALVIREKVINELEKRFGPDHTDLATSYNNLAMTLYKMGDLPKSFAASQKAITIQEKVLGPNHPELGRSYNNLGASIQATGDFGNALTAQKKAIAIFEKVLDSDHPDLATCYHNIGTTYSYLWHLDTAISYSQRALAIFTKKLPSWHPTISKVKADIGFFYALIGDRLNKSEKYLEAIGQYTIAIEFAPKLAKAYNGKGICHYRQKDYRNAIDAYETAYRLDRQLEGSYFNNTGMAYAKLGEFKEAKIRIEQLEQLQPDQYLAYRAWAVYYGLKGDAEKSISNLEKAIKLHYDDWNWIKTEEAFDKIRNTDRFKALLQLEKR